jgi:methane/ammonia monooxygenase subunit B
MKRRFRRLFATGMLLLVGLLALAPTAFAHGERAQEGFLRSKTVAFYDVEFTGDKISQGETITVTGKVKILETWPKTLGEPELGYIGIAAPGPVLFMKERYVNGVEVPGSILIERGGVYDFKMVLEGRREGEWHIHPIIAVEGAGALVGPGHWYEIRPVAGGYSKEITLMNGKTINIENYGLSFVLILSFITFVLGVWYMLYWTVPKPTVTRLAVTNHLPLNDGGESVGLITKKDHRFVSILAALAVLVTVGGSVYAATAYAGTIPLQVVRFKPPVLEQVNLVEVRGNHAVYDVAAHKLTMTIDVKNISDRAVQLEAYHVGGLTFANQAAGAKAAYALTVDTDHIAPNETKEITITITDPIMEEERLLALNESNMTVAGLLAFEGGGQKSHVSFEAPLRPTIFR